MKQSIIFLVFLFTAVASSQSDRTMQQRGCWMSVYAVDWAWSAGTMKNELIADNLWTHVICAVGTPNGANIDWNTNGQAMLNDFGNVSPTLKSAGIRVIMALCCYTWGGSVTNATTRAGFIHTINNAIAQYNIDGLDIDWEDLSLPGFDVFVTQLRDSMTARGWTGSNKKDITCYVNPINSSYVAPVASLVDQINVQQYDLVAPPGALWKNCFSPDVYITWHQSPLWEASNRCPGGGHLPNITEILQTWKAAGVPANKLAVVARPDASIWYSGSGTPTGGPALPLQIVDASTGYHNDAPYYYWWAYIGAPNSKVINMPRVHDAETGGSYISYDTTGSANDWFVSYDDGWACARKTQYSADSLYGGVYVWRRDGFDTDHPTQQLDSLRYYFRTYTGLSANTNIPPQCSWSDIWK